MRKTPVGRVFSTAQVAAMCRVSRQTVLRWVQKYGLVAYNTQHCLAIKILESDLRKFSEDLRVYVDWAALDEDD